MYDPIKVGTASFYEVLQGILLAIAALYLGAWGTALVAEGWDEVVRFRYGGTEALAMAGPKYLIFNAIAGWGIPTLLLVGLTIRQVVFKGGSRRLWGGALCSSQMLAGIMVGVADRGWENLAFVRWVLETTDLDSALLLVGLEFLGIPLMAVFGIWLLRRLYQDGRDGPEEEEIDLVTLRREWGSGR